MKFRSAFAVLSMTVALAACGELPFQKSEPEAPGHSGPPNVSPLEQPIETGAEGKPVATGESSTMGTAMFRAAGNGWAVTAADKTAVYERSGARSVGVTVRRMVYGGGVEFIGLMNGSVFALNIQAAECGTGSDKTRFTARLRVGSQRLEGCATPTDTMPKAQVRASSAAPKPKAQPKPAAPVEKPAAAAEDAPADTAATPETTPAETAPATTPATTPPATTAPETPPAAQDTTQTPPGDGAAQSGAATPGAADTAPAAGTGAAQAPATPPAAQTPATGDADPAAGAGSQPADDAPVPGSVLPPPPEASE